MTMEWFKEALSCSDNDEVDETRTGVYVTELGPADVLLGRGTGPSMNEGNVRFRQVVEDLKPAYVSTPSRKAKRKIVRNAVYSIQAQNGRFLVKLRKSDMRLLGLRGKEAYEVVPDSVAFEKTKQAIRYVHYRKDPSQVSKTSPKKRPLEDICNPVAHEHKKVKLPEAGKADMSRAMPLPPSLGYNMKPNSIPQTVRVPVENKASACSPVNVTSFFPGNSTAAFFKVAPNSPRPTSSSIFEG
eukprot:Nitzschia sp. Nitz4//scaffold29_size155292//14348//15128//NITZ4_002635-RA/size155292-processed-gene-0.274-mRNA-1//-1//CDS//3329546379//6989//frame0